MNEKMKAAWSAARRTAVQAGSLAAAAACGMGRMTGDLVTAARTKYRVAVLENRVQESLEEVGRLLYATHTGSPTDSEVLQEKLQRIDALRAEIARLQGRPAEGGKSRICPACGAINWPGDAFCRSCGGKL